jgi:UDP-N-acetylglucosamine 1-carboxyvinyltransferase
VLKAFITGVLPVWLRVNGGAALRGTVRASGSKNAALALMAAAMLAEGETVLRSVPRIADIEVFRELMGAVGVPSDWTGPHTLVVAGGHMAGRMPPLELARRLRASYYLMGPLLGRLGRARVGLPGGCTIGARPMDLHFRAFEALGAHTRVEGGEAIAEAVSPLRGADMTLVGAFGSSVGATINAMLAACVTPGVTRIHGAAQEPEVWETAAFLNRAGARITGAGTALIEVEGVAHLQAVAYDVPGDRIEAATYLLAAAATHGAVTVAGVAPWTLNPLPELLEQMGCRCEAGADFVRVEAPAGRLRAATVETGPFPALATDVQPVLVAALCLADGISMVGERVFDARLGYTPELERLGANIRVVGNNAVITGVARLGGAPLLGKDLRASAALVVAALAAEGESMVEGLAFLDRGYEAMEAKLTALGASICREEQERAKVRA